MKIIKQGKPELQIKPSKQKTMSCSKCGCVFQYDDCDTHINYDWEDWYEWIVCPWCNTEIYGIFNF